LLLACRPSGGELKRICGAQFVDRDNSPRRVPDSVDRWHLEPVAGEIVEQRSGFADALGVDLA
jgi:hypothetical protein